MHFNSTSLTKKNQYNPLRTVQIIRKAQWERSLKLIAYTLASYTDPNGHCYPSLTRLSKDSDYSISTVKRAIRKLKAVKIKNAVFLIVHPQGNPRGTGNLYIFPQVIHNVGCQSKIQVGDGVTSDLRDGVTSDPLTIHSNYTILGIDFKNSA